ncbi:MAG: recombinase family protein [Mediterraneibacter gnavus]
MIQDCKAGKIDMIIVKNIPRFARNTLDTLKYVRMLKEINVAVYFEKENIHTIRDGEFLICAWFYCTTRSRKYYSKCKNGVKNENETRGNGWI